MGLKVSMDHPDFPQDTEFGIDHLGVVPNGGSLDVPEENEQRFVNVKGQSVEDAFPQGGVVTVTGGTVQPEEAPQPATQEAEQPEPPAETTEGSVS